jgi:hypothetical protein
MQAKTEKVKRRTVNDALLRMQMLVRGFNESKLAARIDCSLPFTHLLLAGARRSQKKENKIAQLLGIPRSMIWLN